MSLVIFKNLIVHRSCCGGCVFIEFYGICNRSPLCIQILIARATHRDNGNLGSGIKSIACVPTAEDITFTSGIFKVNVCRIDIISVGIVFVVCTAIQVISDIVSIVIPISNVFLVANASGINNHGHGRFANICSRPPKESIANSCGSCQNNIIARYGINDRVICCNRTALKVVTNGIFANIPLCKQCYIRCSLPRSILYFFGIKIPTKEFITSARGYFKGVLTIIGYRSRIVCNITSIGVIGDGVLFSRPRCNNNFIFRNGSSKVIIPCGKIVALSCGLGSYC